MERSIQNRTSSTPVQQQFDKENSNHRPQAKPTGASKRKPSKGARVLKEIKRYQSSTDPLIPKLVFSRIVREIMQNVSVQTDMKITADAMSALLESASCYLTQMFEDAYRVTLHCNRVTLKPEDLQLLFYLRGINDPGSRLSNHSKN